MNSLIQDVMETSRIINDYQPNLFDIDAYIKEEEKIPSVNTFNESILKELVTLNKQISEFINLSKTQSQIVSFSAEELIVPVTFEPTPVLVAEPVNGN